MNYKCDKYNQSIPRTTAEGEQIDGHVVGRELGQAACLATAAAPAWTSPMEGS